MSGDLHTDYAKGLLFPAAASSIAVPEKLSVQEWSRFPSFKDEKALSHDISIISGPSVIDSASWDKSALIVEKDALMGSLISEDDDTRKVHSVKKKKSHKHKHKHRKKRMQLQEEDFLELSERKLKESKLPEKSLHSSPVFSLDRRPDVENIQFETLYHLHVSQYVKHQSYVCLGSRAGDRFISKARAKKTRKPKDLFDERYFNPTVVQSSTNFLSDEDERKFVNELETKDFLPVYLHGKKESNPIAELVNSAERFGSKDFLDETKRFSILLAENPHNVDAWIEFINLQTGVMASNPMIEASMESKPASYSSRAVTERKISVVEKALKHNPGSSELIILRLNLLKETSGYETVHDQWKNVLFKFPNNSRLWSEYLLFMQSSFTQMTISKVVEAYHKCFAMLLGIIEGSVKSHKAEDHALINLTRILVQYLVYLWQAGYSERVIAILHCFMEFNLRLPTALSAAPLRSKLSFFEAFYGSNSPRFGAKKSEGWDVWMSKQQGSPLLPVSANLKDLPVSMEDLFRELPDSSISVNDRIKLFLEQWKRDGFSLSEAWLQLENMRIFSDVEPFIPAVTDEECEDPERMVLFDDIAPCLFTMRSKELEFQLSLVFLYLLGVPVDKLLFRKELLSSLEQLTRPVSSLDDRHYACLCHAGMICPFVHCSSSILFSGKQKLNVGLLCLIRLFFSQILPYLSDRRFQCMSITWLHFESIVFNTDFEDVSKELSKQTWKQMRKFAKALLKLPANRACVELWTNYATLECLLGNTEEGEQIFRTSFALCREQESGFMSELSRSRTVFIARKQLDVILSDHFRKDSRVSSEEKIKLFNIISRLADASLKKRSDSDSLPFGPATQLKTQRLLQSEFDAAVVALSNANDRSQTRWQCLADFMICFMVFEAFFSGLHALKGIYSKLFGDRRVGLVFASGDLDDVVSYFALLTKLLVKQLCSETKWLRHGIEELLIWYPENEVVNRVFLDLKQAGPESLYARRCYENLFVRSSAIQPWLFAIQYEMSRLERHSSVLRMSSPLDEKICLDHSGAVTGIHNRIRSLFRRLCARPETQFCAHLWLDFLKFEGRSGEEKSAKKVYYDAIQHCPWVKEIYLQAVRLFPSEFQEIIDLMQEKELRLKVLVEEVELALDTQV